MWENNRDFGAINIFAEHRYYGKSLPCVSNYEDYTNETLRFLTSEQAMSDFVDLIYHLKAKYKLCENAPVIAFGGSYGGMLATWLRLKYPHVIDGAIAASAPIWYYPGENPPHDPTGFYRVVTETFTKDGGNVCRNNINKTWSTLSQYAQTSEGLQKVARLFKICNPDEFKGWDAIFSLQDWIISATISMAEGNYPFASNYLTNGGDQLPPWPVRVACSDLQDNLEGDALLEGISKMAGVFYNSSGNAECFKLEEVNPQSKVIDNLWYYQSCTEQYDKMETNGVTDMFPPGKQTDSMYVEGCQNLFNVTPRKYRALHEWGGKKIIASSNIVFSNGLYDPWHSSGVLYNISDTLVSTLIPEGGHHLDLFFQTTQDPESVKIARQFELQNMWNWVHQACGTSNNSQYQIRVQA